MIVSLLCLNLLVAGGSFSPIIGSTPGSKGPPGYFLRWSDGEVNISGNLWHGTDPTQLLGLFSDDPALAVPIEIQPDGATVVPTGIHNPVLNYQINYSTVGMSSDQAVTIKLKVRDTKGAGKLGLGLDDDGLRLLSVSALKEGSFLGGIPMMTVMTPSLAIRFSAADGPAQADLYGLTLNLGFKESPLKPTGLIVIGWRDPSGVEHAQRVYDSTQNKLIEQNEGQSDPGDVADQISRDGKLIAGTSWGRSVSTLWVYDLSTGRELLRTTLPYGTSKREDFFGTIKWHCDGAMTVDVGDTRSGKVKFEKTFSIYKTTN